MTKTKAEKIPAGRAGKKQRASGDFIVTGKNGRGPGVRPEQMIRALGAGFKAVVACQHQLVLRPEMVVQGFL